jgi:hypothetical protein
MSHIRLARALQTVRYDKSHDALETSTDIMRKRIKRRLDPFVQIFDRPRQG